MTYSFLLPFSRKKYSASVQLVHRSPKKTIPPASFPLLFFIQFICSAVIAHILAVLPKAAALRWRPEEEPLRGLGQWNIHLG